METISSHEMEKLVTLTNKISPCNFYNYNVIDDDAYLDNSLDLTYVLSPFAYM